MKAKSQKKLGFGVCCDSDNLFHLLYNIRMSGSDIMVFMNICGKIVKKRLSFFHNHLPVSHTYTNLIGFVKFPIQEIMLSSVLPVLAKSEQRKYHQNNPLSFSYWYTFSHNSSHLPNHRK